MRGLYRVGVTSLASLGTTIATVELVTVRRRPFLRRADEVTSRTDYLDWTADGAPVRHLFEHVNPGWSPVRESTLIAPTGSLDEYTRNRLRALLGLVGEEVVDAVFPGGRVGILFCIVCSGLDCNTLSAEITFDDDIVTWRDIGFQTDWEPYSLGDQTGVTVTFAREQYETTIRAILDRP